MGYTTNFKGAFKVDPPLSEREIEYLKKFARTRRMDREKGPYFVDGDGVMGQAREADIRDYNAPPEGQPGLWCKWEPSEDGAALEWNGWEKFYDADKWMAYLVNHFLKGRPAAALTDPGNMGWLPGGHRVDGRVWAAGEDTGDVWMMEASDGNLRVSAATDAPSDSDSDEDGWEDEHDGRLETAEAGGYCWGEPTVVPAFHSPDFERLVRAAEEAEKLDASMSRGKAAPWCGKKI